MCLSPISHFRLMRAHDGAMKTMNENSPSDHFGLFQESIINMLCETFLPIYKEVEEPLWNNSIYGYVKRSHHFYDQDLGVFEFYVPTAANGEGFMQYCRIIVKVIPDLDPETLKEESRKLRTPYITPTGIIDSEMIFVVAQKARRDEKGNLPRGFRHGFKQPRMTYAIVREFPERVLIGILSLVKSFFMKRYRRFVESLKLPTWMSEKMLRDIKKGKKFGLIYNLGQRFSLTIMTILENFLGLCSFISRKLKKIYRVIGEQNVLAESIRKLNKLKEVLAEHTDLPEILATVNGLILKLRNKLNSSPRKKLEKCSFITLDKKEHQTNIYNDLEKREKLYLSYLESQIRLASEQQNAKNSSLEAG